MSADGVADGWVCAESWRTASPEDTMDAGRWLAGRLRRGEAVSLVGPLGAGKTTFARGVIAGLGHHGRVRSPSFTLVNRYETDPVIIHADLYRVLDSSELLALDFDESREEGVLLVEWADRVETGWGVADWRVTIEVLEGENERLVTIEARR